GKCSVGMLSLSGNTGAGALPSPAGRGAYLVTLGGLRDRPWPTRLDTSRRSPSGSRCAGADARERGSARARGGQRAVARPGLRDVLVRVIARAHERTRGDALEAQLVGRALERGELVGMPVADDREVALGRAQVLPDREDLDAVVAQSAEGLDHLLEA